MTTVEAAELLLSSLLSSDHGALELVREEPLTPEEAAEELAVGRTKFYDLMASGLPWHPLGDRGRRIFRSEMNDWLKEQSIRPKKRMRAEVTRATSAAETSKPRRQPRRAAETRSSLEITSGTDRDSLRELVRRSRSLGRN